MTDLLAEMAAVIRPLTRVEAHRGIMTGQQFLDWIGYEAEARSSHSDVSADPDDPTRQLREHLHTFHSPVFDAEHLRALSDVATPGPWELGRKRVHGISAPNGDGYHTVSVHGNDAALIVAAVNAVRAALGKPR